MAVNSEFILAGPLDAARSLVHLIPEPEFWGHIGFSLARIALGTAAGYVLAIALAACRPCVARGAHPHRPALSAIKSTPVACVVVVLLIWFGSRNVSAIAVFLLVLPGVYFPVLKGLDQLDPAREELFWLYRARWGVRLLAHVVPGVLPYLVSASATVLSMSWKAGVAAELIGVPDGSIGERIYQAKLSARNRGPVCLDHRGGAYRLGVRASGVGGAQSVLAGGGTLGSAAGRSRSHRTVYGRCARARSRPQPGDWPHGNRHLPRS